MASVPKPKATEPSPDEKLQKEANDRRNEAKRRKAQWLADFKECYFFANPQRQREMQSETTGSTERVQDAAELQTSLAFLLCADFITEVVQTFMPESLPWCERTRGMFVNADAWDKIKDQVKQDDAAIFDAMKASNLYSEIPKAFNPDLAIGTAGLLIERPQAHGPITAMAVPLRELEINLGPYGEIDDRFAVRYTRNCHVRALLPGITLPQDIADRIEKKPDEKTQVVWGYWRLWDRVDDEVWQHVVLIKDKKVHDAQMSGEGCCPLLVPRFNPSADWPWALGPLLQGLPDLRQVDELEGSKVENIDLALRPPMAYPDDSFAAIEQGLESGMAYPVGVDRGKDIKPIYQVPAPDKAVYLTEEMEHRLRKLFFIDHPEQTGDTPPTLGQWLDELARAQRRIGTPGTGFWREGPAKIFLRYKYLLEVAGTIKPVMVDGKSVALMPYNPAQRAAEQQEIATAFQCAQFISQTFPEEFKVSIDGSASMKAIIDKMRTSGLLVARKKEDVQAALGQITQLMKGQGSGLAPGNPTSLQQPQIAP